MGGRWVFEIMSACIHDESSVVCYSSSSDISACPLPGEVTREKAVLSLMALPLLRFCNIGWLRSQQQQPVFVYHCSGSLGSCSISSFAEQCSIQDDRQFAEV